MGLNVIEIAVRIRRVLIFPIRTLYRSVRDHPFYSGMVFFSIFLYRYFPSLFGLLVSSFPILFCTAILLGTLLIFGNPNIPEIEKDDRGRSEVDSLRATAIDNNLTVRKNESFSAEAHLEKRREVEEKMVKEPMVLEEREANADKVDADLVYSTINDNCKTTANEKPKEYLGENQQIKEGEFGMMEFPEKQAFHEEESLIGAAFSASKDIDGTTSIGWREIETPRRKIDLPSGAFSISQDLSWKHAECHSGSYDSDSDHNDSSSPDASMADLMPLLDELHPLLESEASQPPLISLGNSNAVSENSIRSNDGSNLSEEDTENQDAASESSNRSHDGSGESEEEIENQGDKEDGTNNVVTWTEDDQKNLMDLGTLELERNKRLESLIAKRRLRKLMTMEPEKNLIDLDSNDPPFSIAPILTSRQNPFDFPIDSYEAMGLPPIPGSAPSVLLPRRNPFDLPYEPYEEKPNLMDDSFQQEFTAFQPKEMQFRRHESFSLGAAAESKQRSHLKPYFVTERLASEGAEYPIFHRQWSDKSDSKVSSVPETESAFSVADQEDQKAQLSQEGDLTSQIGHASDDTEYESQTSKEDDLVETDAEERRGVKIDAVDVKGINEDRGLIHIDSDSDHVEHESQSSEELDSAEIYPEESGDFSVDEVGEETSDEVELHQSHSGLVALLVEPENEDFPAVEERYSDSSSSLSEVHEKLFHTDPDEGSRDLKLNRDDNTEGSSVSIQSSLIESDSNLRSRIMEGGDDIQIKEPVYDSSPSATEKTISNITPIQDAFFYVDKGVITSFPSMASDLQVEVSEVGSPSVLVDEENAESVYYEESRVQISPGNEGSWVASPTLCAVDENEFKSKEVNEISEHDGIEVGFSEDGKNSCDPHVPKLVVGEAAIGSSSTSKEASFNSEQDLSLSSSNPEFCGGDQRHDANIKVDIMASRYSDGASSEGLRSSVMENSTPLVEDFTVHQSTDFDHRETQDSFDFLVKSNEEANVLATENEDSSSLSMLTVIKPMIVPTNTEDGIHARVQSGDGSLLVKDRFLEVPEITSELQVLEAKSIGDANMEFKHVSEGEVEKSMVVELIHNEPSLKKMEVESADVELSNQGPNPINIGSELSTVEARSPLDIESDFNRLNQGFQETVLPEPVQEKSVTEESGIGPSDSGLSERDSIQSLNNLVVPVLEAESMENIDATFQNHGLENTVTESFHESLTRENSEHGLVDSQPSSGDASSTVTDAELSLHGASSFEDIDMALKELQEGVRRTCAAESLHDKAVGETSEVVMADSGLSEKNTDLSTTGSQLPVLEARSFEVEVKEMERAKESTSGPKESGTP